MLGHHGALVVEALANEQFFNARRGIRLVDLVSAVEELGQHANELGDVGVGDLVPKEVNKLHACRLQHWQVV